ncbi:MAG: endonuclease/exonuclease/phosphatase family protein [Porphyromonadaceae bacterium]|nr:endonuclease/exonuclease/phosphatase family protein [Porphyromonadaceae bacterium]
MRKNNFILLTLFFLVFFGAVSPAQTVKLLNMNIRMSGQMTGYNVAPFANFIREYDPDFVTLQEVDFKTERNGKKDFTTELAAELGYFSAFGPAIEYQQGEYGVAILSKYPIEKISNNRLTGNPAEMKEPRTVLYADVIEPLSKQKIRIAVTHLDHSTDGVRTSMVQQLNGVVGAMIPTLLAGDFNAKPNEPAIITGMASWQRICNNYATFPSSAPSSKIDYIFGKPAGKWIVKSFEVLTNVTAMTDHCAMVTEVQLSN